MTIDYADLFPVLAEALPDFEASAEDWDDRLAYPFLSDMVRFVCDRAYPEISDYDMLLRQFAALMERLISEGDRDVHDLAHDGLESVWEHHDECTVVAGYFGPKTREVWERICAGEHGQ